MCKLADWFQISNSAEFFQNVRAVMVTDIRHFHVVEKFSIFNKFSHFSLTSHLLDTIATHSSLITPGQIISQQFSRLHTFHTKIKKYLSLLFTFSLRFETTCIKSCSITLIMNQTRKRLRSDEANYGLQSKLFVNQKIMDQSDENLMKNVYGEWNLHIFERNSITNKFQNSR